jgi:hypothetical protein
MRVVERTHSHTHTHTHTHAHTHTHTHTLTHTRARARAQFEEARRHHVATPHSPTTVAFAALSSAAANEKVLLLPFCNLSVLPLGPNWRLRSCVRVRVCVRARACLTRRHASPLSFSPEAASVLAAFHFASMKRLDYLVKASKVKFQVVYLLGTSVGNPGDKSPCVLLVARTRALPRAHAIHRAGRFGKHWEKWNHTSDWRRLAHLSQVYSDDERVAQAARREYFEVLRLSDVVTYPRLSDFSRNVSLQHTLDAFMSFKLEDARATLSTKKLKTVVAIARLDHALTRSNRSIQVKEILRLFVNASALCRRIFGIALSVRTPRCATVPTHQMRTLRDRPLSPRRTRWRSPPPATPPSSPLPTPPLQSPTS